MRERIIRPRGPRGRERVGGNISAYDGSLLHDGWPPHGYAPGTSPARRGWQGCLSFSLFLFLSEWDESFRDIPPTDRDSPDPETSDCSERSDWFDVAENSNAESAGQTGRTTVSLLKFWTSRGKRQFTSETHLTPSWWSYGDDNILFLIVRKLSQHICCTCSNKYNGCVRQKKQLWNYCKILEYDWLIPHSGRTSR